MYADSSVAIAIPKRRGPGKLRHIDIAFYGFSKKVEDEHIIVKKVKWISSLADIMANYLNKEKLDKYMDMTEQEVLDGRESVNRAI